MQTWMPAADAVALLGVKRATLYAYASRGKVQTRVVGREKRYLASDLERLLARQRARSGHGPVAADALRWGEPVLDSAITEIAADGHRYRGVDVGELAEAGDFEATAELLWGSALSPSGWPCEAWPLAPGRLSVLVSASARPVDVLAMMLPAAAMRDVQRWHRDREPTLVVARRVIRLLAAAPALARGAEAAKRALAEATVVEVLLSALGTKPTRAAKRAVAITLIQSADHGLNPSSFAARVAASAGADLYACLVAALATLSGPRHGGVTERLASLFDEIDRPARTARVIGERLQRGDEIPGFGHTLYPRGDPRAVPLMAAARRVAPRSRRVGIVEAVVETMKLAGGQPPTLDIGLAAVAAALGLPRGGATVLFAVGRAAGWVAQVLEQREAGYILRPRARYIGP